MGRASDALMTRLLDRINQGDSTAHDQLMAAVYDDLRDIAGRQLNRHFGPRNDLTLQPTALVHEGWLRLIRQRRQFDNRGQFFAIATKVMIRVLLDYARQRQAAKRGAGCVRISLDLEGPAPAASDEPATRIAALAGALERLEALDARKADVVKMRVLWGLTIDEITESLGVGRATIDRDWAFAKAWLRKELTEANP